MNRNLHPSFQETLDRYANSLMPDIMIMPVRWPELHQFLETVRQLARSYGDFAVNESVDEDLRRWSHVKRILTGSLVQPFDPSVGIRSIQDLRPLSPGQLGELQSRARESAVTLGTTEHPGVKALADLLSGRGRLKWPSNATKARVIVQSQAVDGTTQSLASIETDSAITWQVCTLTQAKRLGTCDVTIIPGSAELQVDWRTPWERRPRTIAWLFNAPMSPHVVSMLWPGSRPFESRNYEPTRSSSVLDPRFSESLKIEYDPAHWEEDIRLTSRPPLIQTDSNDEPVESIDFRLPDNYWISFGVELGPKASRIDEDAEFEVEIETRLNAKQLKRGDTLVILEATADRTFRRKHCWKWIKSKRFPFSPDEAQRCINGYKSAVVNHPRDLLLSELESKGMPREIALRKIQRASLSDSIAPQNRADFELFAKAASFELPDRSWEYVEALRGGYMHAGRVIRDALQEAVRHDQTWQDTVSNRLIARIEVENLGLITMAPVLSIESETVMRPENQLGELVKV